MKQIFNTVLLSVFLRSSLKDISCLSFPTYHEVVNGELFFFFGRLISNEYITERSFQSKRKDFYLEVDKLDVFITDLSFQNIRENYFFFGD